MPYEILLAPEAVEDFRLLKPNVRATVRDALDTFLRYQPTTISKSRIKRLRGLARPQYRLRVDEIRVFYDVSDNTVEILAIVDKPDTAAWLEREGVPDEADSTLGSEE